MSRSIDFEPDLKCDNCGAEGAFDFMGDALCSECSSKIACKQCGSMSGCECEAGEMSKP
jgi:hypothetical protein